MCSNYLWVQLIAQKNLHYPWNQNDKSLFIAQKPSQDSAKHWVTKAIGYAICKSNTTNYTYIVAEYNFT